MRKADKRTQRGAALIIAIAIMVVMLAIGLTFFTVARVESNTAMNVVNTVRAEHLVDAGFAMAEYQLNCDLQAHPGCTSLDHGWRTLFNGAAYAGKNWANSTGVPAFNMEPVEQKLRGSDPADFGDSLLYVKFTPKTTAAAAAGALFYMEPLFRGPFTAPWLAIPRWQGDDILIYPKDGYKVELCNASGAVVADAVVNAALAPVARIVRFDLQTNAAAYPFVTSSFFGQVQPMFGLDALWPAEQVDRFADVDTNGDGMRDSIWVPLPKDVDLSADGVDNDLDGVIDPIRTPDVNNQITVDEDGNPRHDFEVGAFVYRIANASGRFARNADDVDSTVGMQLRLTIPLPGLNLPIDMNNDGRIDSKDYYNTSGVQDSNGSPVYVHLPGTINVPTTAGVIPLTINDVDQIDNDYDQFVNGFNAYVFLGDPNYTSRTAAAADEAFVRPIAGADTPSDFVNARTKLANKIIKWYDPVAPIMAIGNNSLSDNAPAWLKMAAVKPVVISLTGEPVCDVVGRAAIQVVDESSKVNMNAAGGHIYRDDIDFNADTTAGQHIERAMNQGASTFEYETRALPEVGRAESSYFWSMLTGAGYMVPNYDGTRWEYWPLSVEGKIQAATAIPYLPPADAGSIGYAYDVSLPGYGRVDDNMNSLLLAFNGRADAGNAHPDQGLWVPPLSPLSQATLESGTSYKSLAQPLQDRVKGELDGISTSGNYPEVNRVLRNSGFAAYFDLLGMMEGIDEPGELRHAVPLRNKLAENDAVVTGTNVPGDNNGDSVANEIGEFGDRLLANHYELKKAVNTKNAQLYGDAKWPDLKDLVTASSDTRNVSYVDTATGPKAINKIDPNLAPPAQIAAGLLIKGNIPAVTRQPAGTLPAAKISLAAPSDSTLPAPLYFAEGLRQADTTFTGYIFDQQFPGALFAADGQLQALQTAVNIADSRDSDCVRSLLVTDKRVTAEYADALVRFYGAAGINPPIEAPNQRERVAKTDAFPLGELQDYLFTVLGADLAQRMVIVDRWWQNLTNAADGSFATVADREDRTISYAAAGTDAIRINELMVRPVRRIEAEAVTHIAFDLTKDNPNMGMRRFSLAGWPRTARRGPRRRHLTKI